jgi:uncharacterized phage-associated protein
MEALTPLDRDVAEVLDRHQQQGVNRVLALLGAAWTQAQLMRMSPPELVSTAIRAWQSRPKGPGLYGK